MSTAEQIAEQLGNDGTVWRTDDGTTLDQLAAEAGGYLQWHPTRNDMCRWLFLDGSVITEAGEAWDFGFATCWCWAGAPFDLHPAADGNCDSDPHGSDNNHFDF